MERDKSRGWVVSGKRWIAVGLILVVSISVFVMIRIVQESEPRPDPSEIPPRPGANSGP